MSILKKQIRLSEGISSPKKPKCLLDSESESHTIRNI